MFLLPDGCGDSKARCCRSLDCHNLKQRSRTLDERRHSRTCQRSWLLDLRFLSWCTFSKLPVTQATFNPKLLLKPPRSFNPPGPPQTVRWATRRNGREGPEWRGLGKFLPGLLPKGPLYTSTGLTHHHEPREKVRGIATGEVHSQLRSPDHSYESRLGAGSWRQETR